MKSSTALLLPSLGLLALVCFQGLATARAAEPMIVEGPTGPVTIKEISAFKNFMKDVPPATNNLHNCLLYTSPSPRD